MGAYRQRYIALEIVYLGWRYHGFASQTDTDQTVEVSCLLIRISTRPQSMHAICP